MGVEPCIEAVPHYHILEAYDSSLKKLHFAAPALTLLGEGQVVSVASIVPWLPVSASLQRKFGKAGQQSACIALE